VDFELRRWFRNLAIVEVSDWPEFCNAAHVIQIGAIAMNWLACLIDDPSGATAIEYAVIVSVIGLALAAALPDIGANIRTLLPTVSAYLAGPSVVMSWTG
jgi:Flp pilus assembly pilin Flp